MFAADMYTSMKDMSLLAVHSLKIFFETVSFNYAHAVTNHMYLWCNRLHNVVLNNYYKISNNEGAH